MALSMLPPEPERINDDYVIEREDERVRPLPVGTQIVSGVRAWCWCWCSPWCRIAPVLGRRDDDRADPDLAGLNYPWVKSAAAKPDALPSHFT